VSSKLINKAGFFAFLIILSQTSVPLLLVERGISAVGFATLFLVVYPIICIMPQKFHVLLLLVVLLLYSVSFILYICVMFRLFLNINS
jgi:hypothetical protein